MAKELTVRERIQLKQIIDRHLDELYGQAAELGAVMGRLHQQHSRSQLRNLETVAAAATRTSVLKNHIKSQTGKDRLRQRQTWALRSGGPSLGERTLKLLDELGGRAATIVKTAAIAGSEEDHKELARVVEIELQRGVVQTAVCAALYSDAEAAR